MQNKVRLAGITYESLVNGPGIRRVFFAQGCIHKCIGCHNKETHAFDGGEVFLIDPLIEDVKENPMIKGITFSGGDPFEQAKAFLYMAKRFKELGLNIWCYTGYTFEEIMNSSDEDKKELLKNIDCLVDGKFVIQDKTDKVKYIGSTNQRIIDVKKTLESKRIEELIF